MSDNIVFWINNYTGFGGDIEGLAKIGYKLARARIPHGDLECERWRREVVFMGAADQTLGYGQPSALFAILVGDTAIALALMTLFTRVVVLTLILWIGGLIYRSLFGGSAAS